MFTSAWLTLLVLGFAVMMLLRVRQRGPGVSRVTRAYSGRIGRPVPHGHGFLPMVLAPASLAVSLCCSACVGTGFPSFFGLGAYLAEDWKSLGDVSAAGAGRADVADPEEPYGTAELHPTAPFFSPERVIFGLLALMTAQAGLGVLLGQWLREPTGALGVIISTMSVLLLGAVVPAALGLTVHVYRQIFPTKSPVEDLK